MNFIINKLIYWHINQLTKKIKADIYFTQA